MGKLMKKGALVAYAKKSPIMGIDLVYKEERYTFNLDAEMIINEVSINRDIKTHIRSAAFLNVLYVKLTILYKQLNKQLQRAVASKIIQYKEKYKTLAEAEAMMYKEHKKLKVMEDNLLAVEEARDLIAACVKSYESRERLLQSVSANYRNENK